MAPFGRMNGLLLLMWTGVRSGLGLMAAGPPTAVPKWLPASTTAKTDKTTKPSLNMTVSIERERKERLLNPTQMMAFCFLRPILFSPGYANFNGRLMGELEIDVFRCFNTQKLILILMEKLMGKCSFSDYFFYYYYNVFQMRLSKLVFGIN